MEAHILESFSIRFGHLLLLARHLAGRFGSDAISGDHLILALIYEDQDRLQEAMELPGPIFRIPPAPAWTAFLAPEVAAKLIHDFKTLIGTGEPLPDHIDMPLAPDAKSMLETAHESAAKHGAKLVMPLHLLAAALGETESQRNSLLREAGVEIEAVLKAISKPDFTAPT